MNKKKKGSEESEEDDQPRRSKFDIFTTLFMSRRRSSREGEPPMGYACRCGATDPGQVHFGITRLISRATNGKEDLQEILYAITAILNGQLNFVVQCAERCTRNKAKVKVKEKLQL